MHGNIANNMYNGVEVIMNFINPKEQVDIQNAYDMLSINFAEYEPDLFNGHNNDHIYEKLTHYLNDGGELNVHKCAGITTFR